MANTSQKKQTEAQQIATIERHFKAIMEVLGLDLTDEHLHGTPARVARAYIKELFVGLREERAPEVHCFQNKRHYHGILISNPIRFFSCCAHHFMPVVGHAHIAYVPKDKIIGLSKINRLVHYYARRPQMQEHLTLDLLNAFQSTLGTKDVAVAVDATHFCVISRGVSDCGTQTHTAQLGGQFHSNAELRQQFLTHLNHSKGSPNL